MGPCPQNGALRGEYQGDPRGIMLTLRRCDQGRRRKEPTGKTVPPQVYLMEQRFTVGHTCCTTKTRTAPRPTAEKGISRPSRSRGQLWRRGVNPVVGTLKKRKSGQAPPCGGGIDVKARDAQPIFSANSKNRRIVLL